MQGNPPKSPCRVRLEPSLTINEASPTISSSTLAEHGGVDEQLVELVVITNLRYVDPNGELKHNDRRAFVSENGSESTILGVIGVLGVLGVLYVLGILGVLGVLSMSWADPEAIIANSVVVYFFCDCGQYDRIQVQRNSCFVI